ncbi:MAG: signal peptide peptidase SppA, partial [Deltaproteobacteria bacterium]|nr:signal peptide peptidase SppA [Deltaproteobacteria bacterium]
MVARVEAELQLASADPEVKAVIIRINSPGGTVTASDILYHRIMRFKKQRDVPVIALLVDMGTSGAYYAALAADEIIAHPTTVTGSIGVVMHSINLVGLMDKLGVHDQTVKTGAKKDIGSPLRDMTADERTLLESVLDDMQSRFMALVRERRTGLSEEAQREIADGRIFSAARAKDIGLVDRIGYLDDTVALAEQMAGLPESRLIMYRRPDEMSETAYSRAAAQPSVINLI